jgi:hypothetical protein
MITPEEVRMISRFLYTFSFALLLSALSLTSAFAKGGFDYICVTGPNLKEEVRISDAALTEDFFTFSNFYKDRTEAPSDPGEGYEILRYYLEGKGAIAFDRLHYYPESGFVFYDGIVNGESEYDGEWYTAKPEIKAVFESALVAGAASRAKGITDQAGTAQPQAETSASRPGSVEAALRSWPVSIAAAATGLAILLVLLNGRRKPSAR